MSTETVNQLRDRMLPMLQVVAEEYQNRVPQGYPIVVDLPEQGTLGLELDPGHSLYVVTEGDQVYADAHYRSSRYDARSSASREKFSGMPMDNRRPLSADPTDQTLRNLIAELCSRFNSQQLLIHITDT
jgi:hypothetical protein